MLVALLSLSSWCLLMVVWLFLAVPWVCLLFVIVVFPDHTHLLFKRISENGGKMLMQVSDQYFTFQISIFLLFGK